MAVICLTMYAVAAAHWVEHIIGVMMAEQVSRAARMAISDCLQDIVSGEDCKSRMEYTAPPPELLDGGCTTEALVIVNVSRNHQNESSRTHTLSLSNGSSSRGSGSNVVTSHRAVGPPESCALRT